MRRSRITRLLPLLCLLLLPLHPAASALPRAGDITVAHYCEMTQSLLEISVGEWQERVNVATRKKGQRKEMLRELDGVTKRYRAQHDEIYRRYGMNSGDALRYASSHRSEIENYLEENTDVRDSIESLRGRIDIHIQQFESATASHTEGVQR